MKRNAFATVLNVTVKILLVCVLAYCLYKLIPKLLEYKESDDAYKKIRSEALKDPETEPETPRESVLSEAEETETETETEKSDALRIDWEKFEGTDIVAWLELDEISYPVLHSDSNQKYLHHLPDGTYNYGGSIFLYSQNSPLFTDEASFIYGHNMANGSMFGKLRRYSDSKYRDHCFYVYLPDGTRRTYRFYSVVSVPDGSAAYRWSFGSEDEFMEWQKMLMNGSMYSNSATPSIDEKYVLLSTCHGPAGTSQRLLVIGQYEDSEQIQEPASWYEDYEENIRLDEAIKKESD